MFGSHRKVLITGANGLLARLIAPRLKEMGYKLYGIDYIPEEELSSRFHMENNKREHPELAKAFPGTYFVADITDKEALQQVFKQVGEIDLVIHLAAALDDKTPNIIYKINVEGTRNIYEMCRENHINRVFFASSVTVVWDIYSTIEPYCLIKEGKYAGDAKSIPKIKPEIRSELPKTQIENENFTAYINSKIEGELIAQEYTQYGISTILGRFGTVTTNKEEEKNLEPRRASVLCGWDLAREFVSAKAEALLNTPRTEVLVEPYFIIQSQAKNRWVEIDKSPQIIFSLQP